MSRVTISEFAIALFDLAEAEARTLQESARTFLASERQALAESAWRGGMALVLAGAAVISLLAGLGFMSWGVYLLTAAYLSPLVAPFVTGLLWLLVGLGFAMAATGKRSGGK